jgi:putative ubiquitin-RnfH superfamily antitoxin RatB of RatAB toxin-antitoxin module
MGNAEPAALLPVRVCYSLAPRQIEQVDLLLPAGSSVQAAVSASGLAVRFASIRLDALDVGIWGRRVSADTLVRAGDRIELYRALTVDPKEARRQRYRAQGERGRRAPISKPSGGTRAA